MQQEAAVPDVWAQKASGPTTSTAKTVYLQVTVVNTGQVNSDYNRPYVHAKENVQAVIWDAGDFYMATNQGSRTAARRILFNIPTVPDGFDMNITNNQTLRTEYLNSTDPRMQLMAGGAANSQLVRFRFWGEYPDGQWLWKLQYRHGTSADDAATSLARVTRGPAPELGLNSADEWLIESEPIEGESRAKMVNGSTGETIGGVDGIHVVPFKLLLKKTR
ncbi:MAG TPA: hypothetical protein VNT57_05790 [Desulfobacteria bacterium]|nr:hypothetical protein [Desulfobacteria bacterium]